ncbi:5-methylcytosine restriction system specificity protein McrC [Corynebacterium sanguinis]
MEVSRDQADLLALGRPPGDSLPATSVGGDPFRELIDLVLLAERGSVTSSPLAFEGAFAPSLLRLLTQERLLSEVEKLIFRVRPRYVEQTETLEMPRGRLSEKSLIYSLATGTPRVESTFDELTTDTVLLQVMASALRVIASDRLPYKIASLRPGLQSRAVHLLRHLSGVTLVSREQALLAAERLWLGPLDQIWKPAIDVAIPVLRDWAVTPESQAKSTDALLVHVSTEKFWEQCVEVALKSAFGEIAVSRDSQTAEGISVPAPWVPRAYDDAIPPKEATSSFPDFMLQVDRRVVVADAKYKLGTGAAPTSSDGYQLFAYSHLATLGGRRSDLAVILYPTRDGKLASQMELERLRDHDYPLWLSRVPFPTRLDLQSPGNWSLYIARLAAVLRDFSYEWSLRPSGSSGPTPGKWTRGFNQDAIVSVADSAASKAFGER